MWEKKKRFGLFFFKRKKKKKIKKYESQANNVFRSWTHGTVCMSKIPGKPHKEIWAFFFLFLSLGQLIQK